MYLEFNKKIIRLENDKTKGAAICYYLHYITITAPLLSKYRYNIEVNT